MICAHYTYEWDFLVDGYLHECRTAIASLDKAHSPLVWTFEGAMLNVKGLDQSTIAGSAK
jgi:hypothetical protein